MPATLTAEGAALDRLEGMVNSYVRKMGATIPDVSGQVESVKRLGVAKQVMRERIRKGMTDPPSAEPDRVREITRMFLS
jgi:hypothetical protein